MEFLNDIAFIRNLIIEKFSHLRRLLQEREQQLLNQLQTIEERYREEEERRNGELQQLLLTKEQAFCSLKNNQHTSTLREVMIPLEAKVRELSVDCKRTECINLEWDSEVEIKIQSLGNIQRNARSIMDHYTSKGQPVLAFGTHKTSSSLPGEFKFPNAIAFDEHSQRIYICDGGNHRVQVFDNTGGFMFTFCDEMATPFGICIFANRVYVTQMMRHTLNVYEMNGNFIRSFSSIQNVELNQPKGVSVSSMNGNIYICDNRNKRIVVLDQSLNLFSLIECNSFPDDVKTTDDQIFILTYHNPCILVYNYYHQPIQKIISYGPGKEVVESYNIFIDQNGNILLTDTVENCVLVFTGGGQLIHRFGGQGYAAGQFVKPRGISMDSDGRIIIASQNPNYPIQFF